MAAAQGPVTMSLAPGTQLGPYCIVSPLGSGGMGEVWRARDERLEREVAIKVLPAAVAGDDKRLARFEREAKALARLSHPNILAIFDFGKTPAGEQEESCAYAVTELLEGESLRDRLAGGALPPQQAATIAAAVADGLAAAHAQGIVHRDLKPENVFLTDDGRAKVLDFGLARLDLGPLSDAQTATSPPPDTLPGTVLGTVGYMAPEQVRGEPADARSDIFSLGCVLYEMLTGARTFARDTAVETMTAILNAEPPAASEVGVATAPELARVFERCLEKAPARRFQSASDLAFALRALAASGEQQQATVLASPAETPGKLSIVVLPFENLSPDAEQEFFCDGITEEIITALSQVRRLRVISRNSAMSLKGARKPTQEIATLLNVDHVLEGSVRKAGERLRITAQLIDAATDEHLWAERFDGTLDDVFDIQEKVARSIADALRVTLTPSEAEKLADRPVSDARAYECVLRARQVQMSGTREGFERALRYYQRAVEIMGDHPVLDAGMATAHFFAVELNVATREESLPVARELTRRAQRNPSSAHMLRGWLERLTGRQDKAIRHFEEAVITRPHDVDALFWLAYSYAGAGYSAAARAVHRELTSIDPLTAANDMPLGWSYLMEGNFSGALSAWDEIRRRESGMRFINLMRMHGLARLGQTEEACRAADETVAEDPSDMFAEATTAFKCALQGDRDGLVAILNGERHSFYWHDPDFPWWAAGWLALVGEKEQALDWLERWIDRGGCGYPTLAHIDPLLENLRGESRFQDLIERIRPQWEQFVPRFGSA